MKEQSDVHPRNIPRCNRHHSGQPLDWSLAGGSFLTQKQNTFVADS